MRTLLVMACGSRDGPRGCSDIIVLSSEDDEDESIRHQYVSPPSKVVKLEDQGKGNNAFLDEQPDLDVMDEQPHNDSASDSENNFE